MYTYVPEAIWTAAQDATPANHTLIGSPSPEQVLRVMWPQLTAFYTRAASLVLPRLIETFEAHRAKLAECELQLPRSDYYLDEPSGMLYVVSDRIAGDRLLQPDGTLLEHPRRATYAARTQHAHQTYLDWVIESGQQYLCSDTIQTRQYILGASMPRPEQGEGLYMVDPEPALFNLRDVPQAITAYQREITQWETISH